MKHLQSAFIIFCLLTTPCLANASTEPNGNPQNTLNKLYQKIQQERTQQAQSNQAREQSFQQQKQQQKEKLAALQKELSNKRKELKTLNQTVRKTEQSIDDAKHQLAERSHALKDLFSVWKQAVKDGQSNMEASIISHESPAKLETFRMLATKTALPDSDDLRALFELLQYDIQQNRQSHTYQGEVITVDGQRKQTVIQRIGTFTTTSEGNFLVHNPANNTLNTLPIQPNSKYQRVVEQAEYQALSPNTPLTAVIDPSNGLILEQLALIPSLEDRFHQGGYIGYAIVTLGLLGILLSLFRWLTISYSQRAIKKQMRSPSIADASNPLGRIIQAYQACKGNEESSSSDEQSTQLKHDTLEVQLQEIVMSEMPKLDKGLGTIKLLAAVAPLLGLLGTVVGMINTFQSITLVGNADPKLMAGGISQALMTTVLGLLVAVPLLFSHNLLAAKSKKVLMFLSQQSLGFIAKYMSEQGSIEANAAQDTRPSKADC